MPLLLADAPARWRLGTCVLAGALANGPASAAHPLQAEDAGTQGSGRVEIENGLSWTRTGREGLFAVQPQLSYGLTPELDVILQPSWLRQGGVRGWGDANLDFKWRWFSGAPWSLGVRAGVALPTDEARFGLPHGTASAHGLLVATYDQAPWTVHVNLGVDRNPVSAGIRQKVFRMSSALMWAATGRLTGTLGAETSSDPDVSRHAWPATWLAGVIYTLRPGLDADVGYAASTGARPATRQWLLGLTYRFAP